jgi:hypothetical protein
MHHTKSIITNTESGYTPGCVAIDQNESENANDSEAIPAEAMINSKETLYEISVIRLIRIRATISVVLYTKKTVNDAAHTETKEIQKGIY